MEKHKQKHPNFESLKKSNAKSEENPAVQTLEVDNKTARNSAAASNEQLTQREAVFLEVMRVVRDAKITIEQRQPIKSLLTENQLKEICTSLALGFREKKISLKDTMSNNRKLNDPKLLESYCLGLVNNWLRRDQRLNGTLVSPMENYPTKA